MAVSIRDGSGDPQTMKTTVEGGQHIPHHKSEVQFADNASMGSNNRVRIADTINLFASKLISGKSAKYWEEAGADVGTATSTHSANNACVNMSVATNGDYVIRQTRMRMDYREGKSVQVNTSGIIGNPTVGTVSRIGYFNSGTVAPYGTDIDGLYFESDETTLSVNVAHRGAPTDKKTKGEWNIDQFDGTGPSGVNITDWDKVTSFVIDFVWSGVSRIRWGLEVDGVIYYCHQTNHAGVASEVYMASPNHSARLEVRSTGGSKTIKHICTFVQSEGGDTFSGAALTVNNVSSPLTIPKNLGSVILAYRVKGTHLDARIMNRSGSIVIASGANFAWELVANPVYNGDPLVFNDVPGSSIQLAIGHDVNATNGANVVTASSPLFSGLGSAETSQQTSPLDTILGHGGVALDGTPDIIALVVTPVSAQNETVYGAVNLRDSLTG